MANEGAPRFVKRERVYTSLKQKILSGSFPPGSCLPSRRSLCNDYKASGGTIAAALSLLEDEKLVTRKSRSGVFVRGETEPGPVELAPRTTAAQKIANDVAREISLGNLRFGELLPGRKALRFQYKASTSTLGKAVEILEQKKLIHRSGSSLVVGSETRRANPAKHKVMICAPRPLDPQAPVFVSLEDRFLNSFERELGQGGASFSGQYDRLSSLGGMGTIQADSRSLGFVYPIAGQGWVERMAGNDQRHIEREMVRLSRLKCPVVIFSYSPVVDCFPTLSFAGHKNIYPLGIDNVKSGRDAGVFLSQLGHHNVAYFSYSTEIWNGLRFEGLKRGISTFWENKGTVQGHHAGSDRLALRKKRDDHRKLLKRKMNIVAKEVFDGFSFSRVDPSPAILREMYQQIDEELQIKGMAPLFEQALSDKAITAWVCADPTVARTAARFLTRNGIEIPRQMSLLSLDDDKLLAVRGITANNMQIDRMGYLAAHCILGDIPVRRNRKGIVECPGRIIERGSVARV